MRYELQEKVPNTYVRHELLPNMTNLPYRWVGRVVSDDLAELKSRLRTGMRIEDRDTGEVILP